MTNDEVPPGYEKVATERDREVYVHDPGNENAIKEVFVIVSRDETGFEGVLAASLKDNSLPTPFVTTNETNLHFFRKKAREMKKYTDKELYVLKFNGRMEVEKL